MAATEHRQTTDQGSGRRSIPGLQATVTITRDRFGIAHVRAESEHDAFFGQGFAAAQDRLWQMEYDRRRAAGRWAEAAGPAALPADILSRRMRLAEAARADIDVMSPQTRELFEAYTAGVNAYLNSGLPLPPEYELTGLTPEPWEAWHSVAAFKVRHVLMGVWQRKLAAGRVLATIGPEALARLEGGVLDGSNVILPPGSTVGTLLRNAEQDIVRSAEHLGFLAEIEAGSNSWAVHGSRTTTGMPVLCNDSHRALDTPTVYWQVHVACPAFDVIGATFPGLPGFPHFGHNGNVAWNITHTSADYQDLYVELFDRERPSRYRTPGGWAEAERDEQVIAVRGGEPVPITVWRTGHGPVVHGDPADGVAIALRYTATDRPCRGFEAIRTMLTARTVAELHAAQREWVDPVNNLVSADTAGNIGYLTRGELPVRASTAGRQFPVPGWTGEHEWTGTVPFERLPSAINPPEGFIATANQRVIAGDDPYIGHDFAPPWRATRIVERILAADRLSPEQIAAIQGDTLSVSARTWGAVLSRVGPWTGDAERARQLLAGWDGDLLPAGNTALLYACFRRTLARRLFQPVVGEQTWAYLTSGEPPALGALIQRWLTAVVWQLSQGTEWGTPPAGKDWDSVLHSALADAWQAAVAVAGPEPAGWRWADHHRTAARHTLAATFPERAAELNPPAVGVGGDADTVQCSGYGWREGSPFTINNLSVYRQVVDMANVPAASFIVPGGVSGEPGTRHVSDQLELWRTHQRIPMLYRPEDVEAGAASRLTLEPTAGERR